MTLKCIIFGSLLDVFKKGMTQYFVSEKFVVGVFLFIGTGRLQPLSKSGLTVIIIQKFVRFHVPNDEDTHVYSWYLFSS
ncbi:MAG: hypothetical protein ACFFB2_04020 [Promethearchaeota archaeon]